MRFDLATATFSEFDDDGFLGVQCDTLSDGTGEPPFEVHHPYGFAARPLDPDEDGTGCSVLYARQGNRKAYAWLANDPRVSDIMPLLRKGESIQYGPKGQFIRCHENGNISMLTFVDGDTDKHTMFVRLDVEEGFRVETPWGRITLGPNGFHVKTSGGARLDLGSISGIPSPLDALATYAKLAAAIVSVEGSAVSTGTDAGATNTAAVASLVAWMTAVSAAIVAVGGAAVPPPPTVTQLGAVY